jgi:small neutral amino acid transporter SnatA (MarC family)
MNNKQKVVIVIMAVLVCAILLSSKWYIDRFFGVLLHLFFRLMPVFIIGWALIYVLKGKKRS